jgi:Gpi18-like mannosyltransferase
MGILNKWQLKALSSVLLLAGMGIRFFMLPVESDDMTTFLYHWYDYIIENGAWVSFGREFSNYSPTYVYILSLATCLEEWIPKLIAIKVFSIFFDFINAYLIYRIIRLQYDHETALLGSAIFLCLPTVFLNSSAWGQSDGIYTCFVLLCLFFILKERFILAIIFFSVALSFKVQAIFIGPFLLLLTLRKRIPWHFYFLVPFVYLAMMIPALLAGRTLWSILGIIFNQANYYGDLSKNAPNLYLFISNDYYSSVAVIGLILTGILAVIWAVGYSK